MQNQNNHYKKSKTIRTLKLLFMLIAFVTMQKFVTAQSKFTRTTFNAAFTPITVGGGATVSTATGSNVHQTGIPIGFSFGYGDSTFTTLGLNTNGFIWFDAVAPATNPANSAMVSTTAPNQCISAWWNYLMDDASSDILYQTQGSPGSRTFTVQYTNYPTYYTGVGATNVRMNNQVILYETTNVIEFRYGALSVTGVQNLGYGAMIGLEWGTGGSGKFIDAVTGSSIVNNRMLVPSSGWPSYNFRFTPGTPATIPAGTYNVGIGQTYNSITQAVADVNHRGITGAVTLNLTDALYDTSATNGSNIFPIFVATPNADSTNKLTITKSGTAATLAFRGTSVNANGSGTGVSTGIFDENSEPLLCVLSSYNTISNLNLVANGTANEQNVDIGLAVCELFGNKGAQYNLFDKITTDLNRTNGYSIGIYSFSTTSPGGVAGSNSYNTYRDINIKDCAYGIALVAPNNATGGPDYGNQIISSSCSTYNYIGDPNVPDDIIRSTTYGVCIGGQSGFKVSNCIIQNITANATTGDVDGIYIERSLGTAEISNNIIRTIRRSNAAVSSSRWVNGIRMYWNNQSLYYKIFNNSISNLLSSYAGASSNATGVVGIHIPSANLGPSVIFEIYNNSISLDGSTFPNASSVCFANSSSSKTFLIKNNVFANFTGAQTGVAYHACLYSNAATSYGNASSLDDYNCYYAGDTANGYFGRAVNTYYKTLADWQAAMTLNPGTDANSQVANPNFVNNATDLHPTSASTSLDGTGTTPPAYVTTDADCKPRTSPHDIGAYWAGCWAEGGTVSPNSATVCAQQTYVMSAAGASSYPGISYQWQRATTPGGPYSNVSGGSGATTTSYTTAKLTTGTYYYVLKVTCPGGLIDYSNELTVTVNGLPNAVITAASDTVFCSGGSVQLNAATAANRSYQWKKGANDIAGATTASYLATTTGTYKVVVTNTNSGCTKSSNGIKVTSNPLPTATITPSGPLSFCAGDSVVLQANTGVGLTYKWKKGANYISGATNSSYTAKTAGTYRVEVTDANSCSKLSGSKTVAIICRQDGSLSTNEISIYPNPAKDILTITLDSEKGFEIDIENTLGEKIIRTEDQHDIDVSNLATGIYFVKVKVNNSIVTQKFIKE